MEDVELSGRISQRHPVYYDPDVRVWHRIPNYKTNLRYLARIGFENGQAKVVVRRPLSPRGLQDLWGIDGWISLFSTAGYLYGKLL